MNLHKTKIIHRGGVIIALLAVTSAIFPLFADTYTDASTGITWKYLTNSDSTTDGSTAVTLGSNTSTSTTTGNDSYRAITVATSLDADKILWKFSKDGKNYTVTRIGRNAFQACTKLTGSLTFPDTVTAIYDYAFSGCSGINKIASFGGVKTIGDRSFDNCKGLDGTEAPDMSKVTDISVYNRLFFSGEVRLLSLEPSGDNRGIGDKAFYTAPITNAILSRKAVDINGNEIFKSCTSLKSMYIPGPDSGSNKTLVRRSNFLNGCTSLAVFLAGPRTGLSSKYGKTDQTMFTNVKGCRIFVPTGSNWDVESSTEKGLAAYEANNKVFYYGPGRELDMAFDNDNGLLTATPATAHALTNVLAVSKLMMNNFRLDVRINITNTIEVAANTLTAEMFENVKFDNLTFAVKTQAQLDTVLNAVPVTAQLAIDPSGATENLEITTGDRKVYVMLPKSGRYQVRKNGFVIIVE